MGSIHKNIHLMLEFLKTPFLVVYFSCNALMTFLIMLSVILLSMLIMVLSNQGLIKHLTCDNKNNCFFSFSLINETLYTGA